MGEMVVIPAYNPASSAVFLPILCFFVFLQTDYDAIFHRIPYLSAINDSRLLAESLPVKRSYCFYTALFSS